MSASEQAQADAAKLSPETLSMFPQDDSVDLTHASANDFLRAAISDIATPDERNALTQSDGKISQDGIKRVERALFAHAYDDNGLISRMSESTDNNVQGVTNALLTAAPSIAKIKAAMAEGKLHKYDLSAIVNAVKKLSALRDEGKPVAKYLQEQNFFSEDPAELREFLSLFERYKRSPKRIAQALKKIASNIKEQGEPSKENLFGKNEPVPLIDLIKQANEIVANQGQQNLFAQEEKSEQKSETPKQELNQQLPRTTSTKISSRQWKSNKAILQKAIQLPDIIDETKELLRGLLKLMEAMENFYSGSTWLSGENLHRTAQFNVERVLGYGKSEYSTDAVRATLQGETAYNSYGNELYYTDTHDLDKLDISPYALGSVEKVKP